MTIKTIQSLGYTTYATVTASEGETLTREKIENAYFGVFGGMITGISDKVAHIQIYND